MTHPRGNGDNATAGGPSRLIIMMGGRPEAGVFNNSLSEKSGFSSFRWIASHVG